MIHVYGPGGASSPYITLAFCDQGGQQLDVTQGDDDREELNAAETGRFEIPDLPDKYGRYELFGGFGQY